jgi:hypothetical protein
VRDLEARVAFLEERYRVLTEELDRLRRRRRLPTADDCALVVALAEHLGQQAFHASGAFEASEALTGKLRELGITDAGRLGIRLSRIEDLVVGGLRVTGPGSDNGGRIWSIRPTTEGDGSTVTPSPSTDRRCRGRG